MEIQYQQRDLVGIVGGMGPLASTAFLSTLYDFTLEGVEQEAGRFILYSDPTVPDRTEAFLGHRDEIVFEMFVEILRALQRLQVQKIVVCCITLHYLLPRLPWELRQPIISLLDPIFIALQEKREPHLFLCTNATLQLRLFQSHPLWESCSGYIVLPQEKDQQAIHALIYHLKAGKDVGLASTMVRDLLDTYHVDAFVAGCTEFHLLSRYLVSTPNDERSYNCIDPLTIIARQLSRMPCQEGK
ncbi:aspartate racemase [Ktedonobacter sp. SOSP1-52]|uniref:aspartate/glutamate racemase family protein n=1 Tax=Ktedonobacter sp. SOSP1-52 TaxID=2778366 RepID=UPI001915A23C|nr:aspartate/glutamate racemase family protein [Ktedonobacter sp. SOSP1-52]GHO70184.1 aspartate racemase [Ktedonobacter sp. SOSP1-52]